jgi:hypothetical protein
MSESVSLNNADRAPETPRWELHASLDDDAFVVSPEVVRVRTSQLRLADSPRLNGLDPDHARALAEIDEPLAPIIVHHPTLHVIDGSHRLEAARMNGQAEIDVRFVHGDPADMFRLAVRANVTHGLPLTRADRQAAAARIIRTHPHLSDRCIAHTTGLAAKTVARIRRRSGTGETDKRIGRDGKARPLNTADGRRIASRAIAARPNASLREVAREAGISVGTVRNVRARLESGEDPVPIQHRTASRQASPIMTIERPAAHHDTNPADADTVIAGLRRDPALRYTESGRRLLRCLGTHATAAAQLREAIDTVPPHCAILVAKVARAYADIWNSLAIELDRQAGECA